MRTPTIPLRTDPPQTPTLGDDDDQLETNDDRGDE